MRSPGWIAQILLAPALVAVLTAQSASPALSNLDLSKPFSTRSPWHLTATQSAPVRGDDTPSGGEEPGQIRLCLQATHLSPCDPQLGNALGDASDASDIFTQPHYLNAVRIVYPRESADQPLLWIQMSSLHSGDGDQRVATLMFAYANDQDRFVHIYQHATGRNNNQEVRYISSGALKGDIISIDPTQNAPYGYWVTVSALTPQYTYKTALHYRSATHYGDNNSLAVIDSEMPNIEGHLGVWKPGMALPLPSGPCPKPRLINMELWCK